MERLGNKYSGWRKGADYEAPTTFSIVNEYYKRYRGVSTDSYIEGAMKVFSPSARCEKTPSTSSPCIRVHPPFDVINHFALYVILITSQGYMLLFTTYN